MTEQIHLMRPAKLAVTDSMNNKPYEIGDILEGIITEKSFGGTSALVGQRLVKLSGDVQIVEEVGEKIRLEITKVTEESIELKYLNDKEQAQSKGPNSDEIKKSIEIPRDYSNEFNSAIKPLSDVEIQKVHQMVSDVKGHLTELIDTMTDVDVKAMLEADLNPSKLSFELMAGIVKHNKTAIYAHDMTAIENAVEAEVAKMKARYGDDERLTDVVRSLKEENLPVNRKQVDRLMEALDKMDAVRQALPDKWINVLKDGGDASLKHVYKAVNSPLPMEKPPVMDVGAFRDMVTKHLTSLELPVTDESVKVAMTMVGHDIPLTKENIEFAMDPAAAMKYEESVDAVEAMTDKIKEKQPVESLEILKAQDVKDTVEASDVKKHDAFIRSRQLMVKLQQMTTVQIARATVRHDVVNLERIFGEGGEHSGEEVYDTSTMDRIITHHRQVEEIRLRMTFEASVRLSSKGIAIETESLEKVVASLKEHESAQMQDLAKVHGLEHVDVAAGEAVEVIDGYRKIAYSIEVASVQVMQRTSYATEQITMRQMMVAYEHSETQVRRDLGDRLEKTFSQIESMLESIGVEATEEAVKAAEILARNEMAITKENLLEVQLVHQKVAYVTTKMNPHLALEMIKMGVSPLDLNLDETMEIIEQYDLKFGETEPEKIARLIMELEKDGAITSEQRESLMGIYRSFDTVVRSKGAATGFLVKHQLPLTVDNLFEAAKYIRKARKIGPVMSVDVDDSFGHLTKLVRAEKSIKEQVVSAIDGMGMQRTESVADAVEMLTEVDADVDKAAVLSKMLMEMTIRSFVSAMSHEGMKGAVQELPERELASMPLNELEMMMKAMETAAKEPVNQELSDLYDSQAIAKFIRQYPSVVNEMLRNEIPLTSEHIGRAMEMNREPFILLTRLREMVESVDNEETEQQIIEKISVASRDILSGEKTVAVLKDVLGEVEKDILMHNENGHEMLTRTAGSTAKLVSHTQMLQVTQDYYQIPVMMGQEIQQLNMYILNDQEDSLGGEEDSMKVIMQFSTSNLGNVTAYMTIQGNSLTMNLQSEYQEDRGLLISYEEQIRSLVESVDYGLGGVSYERLKHEEPTGLRGETSEDSDAVIRSGDASFEIQV